jgi:hypothetical protein
MPAKRMWIWLGAALLSVAALAVVVRVASERALPTATGQAREVVCDVRWDPAPAIRRDLRAPLPRFAPTDAIALDQPMRVAGWSGPRVLALGDQPLSDYDLDTRQLRAAAQTTGRSNVDTATPAAFPPLPTPDPSHAYVNGATRSRANPRTTDTLYFHSGGAVLQRALPSREISRCALAINTGSDGALPIIDVTWSPDGKSLAALVKADAGRLGPALLRVLDIESMRLRELSTDSPLVATSLAWRPNGEHILLTIADNPANPSEESLALVDLAASAIDRDAFGGERFYAASFWGVHWSPDGKSVAVACAQPATPDAALERGRVCLLTEVAQ